MAPMAQPSDRTSGGRRSRRPGNPVTGHGDPVTDPGDPVTDPGDPVTGPADRDADAGDTVAGGGAQHADRHSPVLAGTVGALLAPALDGPDPVLVDATLGLGGHTLALLAAHPRLRVIGIDRDPAALAHATDRLAAAGLADRLEPVHAVYDAIGEIVRDRVDRPVDGVLFDLGVSSMQLDRPERGFAYASDAPLDMRMDPTSGPTAAEVLAGYSEADLARVLREYGEERFAGRIARAIVSRRSRATLRTSAELVQIVRDAIPAAARRAGGHPAKRTFQALRIEVNDELGALRRAVPAALETLRPGGRIAVLAYQSLEDRIVKRAIAPRTVSSTPVDLPVDLPGHEPTFRWLTRGAQRPDEHETADNPRAASARLRAAERVREER